MSQIKIYGQLTAATTEGILAAANQVTTTSGQTVQQVLDSLGAGTECEHDYATDDDINALFI